MRPIPRTVKLNTDDPATFAARVAEGVAQEAVRRGVVPATPVPPGPALGRALEERWHVGHLYAGVLWATAPVDGIPPVFCYVGFESQLHARSGYFAHLREAWQRGSAQR